MIHESPCFTCKKCGHIFSVGSEYFEYFRQTKRLYCPSCDFAIENKAKYVELFFRFYPRFRASIAAMQDEGFNMTGWTIGKDNLGIHDYISTVGFECRCGHEFRIPFTRIRLKLFKEPGVFRCPSCKKGADRIGTAREFFVSFKNVHDSALRLREVRWDGVDYCLPDAAAE